MSNRKKKKTEKKTNRVSAFKRAIYFARIKKSEEMKKEKYTTYTQEQTNLPQKLN